MKIVCRKQGRYLVPVDHDGMAAFAKLREGRDVMVTVNAARNPRHHRLYWAIIRFLREHAVNRATGQNLFAEVDTEIIHNSLKIATGLVRTYVDCETGKAGWVPLSIAWESMDNARFAAFFDAACNTIANRWLPEGSLADDVRRELIAICDGPHAVEGRKSA